MSHASPPTPGLQLHCPVYWLQFASRLPIGLHWQLMHPRDACRSQNPSMHLSHVRPVTFSRQKHWPVYLSHDRLSDPYGLQRHSVNEWKEEGNRKQNLITMMKYCVRMLFFSVRCTRGMRYNYVGISSSQPHQTNRHTYTQKKKKKNVNRCYTWKA